MHKYLFKITITREKEIYIYILASVYSHFYIHLRIPQKKGKKKISLKETLQFYNDHNAKCVSILKIFLDKCTSRQINEKIGNCNPLLPAKNRKKRSRRVSF